ncbi:hypothetical protein [Nonomuraea sp. NPDC049646]|uniref:hypothetical protein n=1 Tax=unclassified Nonomuraea TaxID=2593643 RepID=UPI00379F59B1
MTVFPPQPGERQLPRWPRVLAWTAAAVTLLIAVAGFFLGYLLNLPGDLLDVLDKRSSVISMVLSLMFGVLGIWLQRRPLPAPASLPPARIVNRSVFLGDPEASMIVLAEGRITRDASPQEVPAGTA